MHTKAENLGMHYSINKMDNLKNIELAKRTQKDEIKLNNHGLEYKAFDIEMEEFDMVDDYFNDQSSPQSML